MSREDGGTMTWKLLWEMEGQKHATVKRTLREISLSVRNKKGTFRKKVQDM